MARELVTNVWCDVCLQDDEYSPAEETPQVIVGNLKPRVLAFCERHRKEFYDPFHSVLTDLGQIVGGAGTVPLTPKPDAAGVHPCPIPGCDKSAVPFTHEQSLRNHLRKVHNTTLSEARAGNGTAVISPGEWKPDETCPECGDVFKGTDYKYPARTLGVHRANKHGYRSTKPSNAKGRTARKAAKKATGSPAAK